MLPKLTLPQNVREDARPVQTAAMVLEAALDAHRDGTLDHLLSTRPGASRWLTRIFLQPILGTAGDALPTDRAMTTALTWLMEWAITQLRPDRALTLQIDDRKAWLDSTSWRPAIAVMCHYGFATVPDFKDRYYRRPDETPADNLCGLWNIGPSTYYRYLEKAKRLMARALYEQRLDRRHSHSLRTWVCQNVYKQLNLTQPAEQARWHEQQFAKAIKLDDALSALWHARLAGDIHGACALIQRHLVHLSGVPELDEALTALHNAAHSPSHEFVIQLTGAEVWRARGDAEKEREAIERALHVAVDAGDNLLIGTAYSHLGKYYEPRDPDRAFSCYQDSVEFLRRAETSQGLQSLSMTGDEFVSTLAKLSWLYALRNDPRAKAVLDYADTVRANLQISDFVCAMLEQCWGEYWRRANNLPKALEHQHRTLNIYERLNDLQGIIKANINLSLTYSDLQQYDYAITCLKRVLELKSTIAVSPEAIASTHLNLGACFFWKKDYDAAIHEYELGLRVSQDAGLLLHVRRAHYNLAEAYYSRLRNSNNSQDEAMGDHHATAALAALPSDTDPSHIESTKNLKSQILGKGKETLYDRLNSVEMVANYADLASINEYRSLLATPAPPETHIRAHLAIANAYLSISAKEREAAMTLIEKHGLAGEFADEFKQLHTTFNRELAREQQLDAKWRQSAGDLIDEPHRASLHKQLLTHGYINKSGYAELCNVSLATASKHLGMLAERGLLVQTGKGPATKYVLPETEPA